MRRNHTQLSGKETASSELVTSSVTVAPGNPDLNETGPGSYFEVVKFVNTEKLNSTKQSKPLKMFGDFGFKAPLRDIILSASLLLQDYSIEFSSVLVDCCVSLL